MPLIRSCLDLLNVKAPPNNLSHLLHVAYELAFFLNSMLLAQSYSCEFDFAAVFFWVVNAPAIDHHGCFHVLDEVM